MLRILSGVLILLASDTIAENLPVSPVPSDDDIRGILSERIDGQRRSVGIVVGVIEPEGRRVVAHGHLARDGARQVDGDTVFEIGSVTKVFTALLLADMARLGDVRADDPVANYLPDDVDAPEHQGAAISLEDLATHKSGLPRLPDNFRPSDPNNPYADYTIEQLYQFLSGYDLPRGIGEAYEYSNLGYGLLGHALERKGEKSYEALVQEHVLAPLQMENTGITLTPEMEARLATAHNPALEPVSNWDLPTLAGAGALRSTANDLLNFLELLRGQKDVPLAASVEATLDWVAIKNSDDRIIWHTGGTGGYRSFVGILPNAKVGVVVLSNSFAGIGDIGLHLLDPDLPLVPPPSQHREVAVDPDLYDGYVGRYQLALEFVLTITREGDRLFAQATDQSRFEVFPEGDQDFFYKVVDAQLRFKVDDQGRATQIILFQNEQAMPGPRIEE